MSRSATERHVGDSRLNIHSMEFNVSRSGTEGHMGNQAYGAFEITFLLLIITSRY